MLGLAQYQQEPGSASKLRVWAPSLLSELSMSRVSLTDRTGNSSQELYQQHGTEFYCSQDMGHCCKDLYCNLSHKCTDPCKTRETMPAKTYLEPRHISLKGVSSMFTQRRTDSLIDHTMRWQSSAWASDLKTFLDTLRRYTSGSQRDVARICCWYGMSFHKCTFSGYLQNFLGMKQHDHSKLHGCRLESRLLMQGT